MTIKKIDATEEIFIQSRNHYKKVYEEFRQFAELLTYKAGNAKKPSGKSSSYARYLIRLVIIYEDNYKDSIGEIGSFNALKKLEKIIDLAGFREYNQKENHFPSATISCFRAYVTSKQMIREEIIDTELNNELSYTSSIEVLNEATTANINTGKGLITGPKCRQEKKQTQNGGSYPRNIAESMEAKKKSNYTCEMDFGHLTFFTAKDEMHYVEAHHLIPMAAQDYFENTIDFADNIVTLCPNCHRKIHYALPSSRAEMIEYLYKRHEKLYEKYDITINKKLLLSFYGIL